MSGTFRGDLETLFTDAMDSVKQLPPARRAQVKTAGRVVRAGLASEVRHSSTGMSVCQLSEMDLCAEVTDMCAQQKGRACQALTKLCDPKQGAGIHATSKSCLMANQPVCSHLTQVCAMSPDNKLCPMLTKMCAR